MKLRLDKIRAYGTEYVADFPVSNERPYGYSKWEVHVHVSFSEEGNINTCFRVYPKSFADWNECLYECNSYKELKSWLEEHINEIN